jgi:hypothetical protein
MSEDRTSWRSGVVPGLHALYSVENELHFRTAAFMHFLPECLSATETIFLFAVALAGYQLIKYSCRRISYAYNPDTPKRSN